MSESVTDARAITRDIFSATLGSICCCYVGQPFDTVKVRPRPRMCALCESRLLTILTCTGPHANLSSRVPWRLLFYNINLEK